MLLVVVVNMSVANIDNQCRSARGTVAANFHSSWTNWSRASV